MFASIKVLKPCEDHFNLCEDHGFASITSFLRGLFLQKICEDRFQQIFARINSEGFCEDQKSCEDKRIFCEDSGLRASNLFRASTLFCEDQNLLRGLSCNFFCEHHWLLASLEVQKSFARIELEFQICEFGLYFGQVCQN